MPKTTRKKFILTGFLVFLLFVLAFAIFAVRNFKTAEVRGESMEPTFFTGRRLLFTKAYWLVGDIKKNDIVVAWDPFNPKETIIKRVAYLAGETVDPVNAPKSHKISSGPFVVPEGCVFLLGDNAKVSQDSREFGPLEFNQVLGKVVTLGAN